MSKLDEVIAEAREIRSTEAGKRSYTDFLAMLFSDFYLTGIAFWTAHYSRQAFASMCLTRDFRSHRPHP